MDIIVAILLFSIVTSITPGPNNIMIMASALNFGVKQSLPHYLGICIGYPMLILAVGVGCGALFTEFPLIHQVIKYLGAGYLLYLAYRIARSQPQSSSTNKSSKPLTFLQAVLFQWVNPTAWIVAVGTISAYTTPDNIFYQLGLITLTYLLVCFPCTGTWLFGGTLLKNILKSSKQKFYFNLIMSILLVISVVLIFIK